MTATEIQRLRTELDKCQAASAHSQNLVWYLAEQSHEKTKRIQALEKQITELGGTP